MADVNVRNKKAEYNKKARESGRPKRFTLELPGDENVRERIKNKMSRVKSIITQSSSDVTNTDVISRALDFFIERNELGNRNVQDDYEHRAVTSGYVMTDRENVDQPIFVAALESRKI